MTKEIWTVDKMVAYLASHGINDGDTYALGGLGGGEIDGIEKIDGHWYTYFSERGSKNNYKQWPNEHEACEYIVRSAEELARVYGMWQESE